MSRRDSNNLAHSARRHRVGETGIIKLDPRKETGRKGKTKIQWRSRLRVSKDVATSLDWFPTVDGLMHVQLFEYNPEAHKDGTGMWRVHVSGEDDAEMELDVYDERRARYVFDRITHLTTRTEMRQLGLIGMSHDDFIEEAPDLTS